MMARKVMAGASGGAGAFTPADLFAGGEDGFWYDLSDTTTLWQDTGATTQADTNGDPIARIDDKSGNGYNATEAAGAAMPTLNIAAGVNWADFDGGDKLTISGSTATLAFLHKDGGTGLAFLNRMGTTADENAAYVFLGNNGTASSNTGISLFFDDRASVPRNERLIYSVARGVNPTFVYQLLTSDGDYPTPIDQTVFVTTPAGGPAEILVGNVSKGTIAKSNAVNSGNATFNLQIGAAGNGALPMTGRMYQVIVRDAEFTTQELDDIQTYFEGKL